MLICSFLNLKKVRRAHAEKVRRDGEVAFLQNNETNLQLQIQLLTKRLREKEATGALDAISIMAGGMYFGFQS